MFKTPRKHEVSLVLKFVPNPATESAIKNLEKQFCEYAVGARKKFNLRELGIHSDLRELKGTDLQRRVWRELLEIPYGKVLTYSELAQKVGKPKAVRAVASAVASNLLYIVIPCHRVVPKGHQSKTLHGLKAENIGNYALGPNMKKILLKIEGVI